MSSETDNTVAEWREEISKFRRSAAGMIRLMKLSLTDGFFWRVIGHLLMDNRTQETRDAEVFGVLGFYSRPKAGANADAIVVNAAGSANPVIIGTRDEDLRKAVAVLAQGQTAMCNRATIILCKEDGTVEIRTPGGVATKLPTLADYEALRAAFNAHVHVAPGGSTAVPTASGSPLIPVATPAGTTVLKAQ